MTTAVKTMQEIEAITETHPVPVGSSELFTELLAQAIPSSDYTGAVLLVEKSRLIGVPFVITAYTERPGVGDAPYVFARCVLPNGREIGFTDGGSGIRQFLNAHAAAVGIDDANEEADELKLARPLFCARGLQQSDYVNDNGVAATTFWLA